MEFFVPLILAPSFDEHTREQIEQHLDQVRNRRMVAAIQYHSGQTSKLSHESAKVQARRDQKYVMLLKEIGQLDNILEKVENRLAEVEHLDNELGLVNDLRELHVLDKSVTES